MGIMANFFLRFVLPLFTRPGGSPEITISVSQSHDGAINAQQAAVEAPEVALLQDEVDLEAGRLETPQLSHDSHQASAQEAVEAPEAVMPDLDPIAGMGLSPPRLQLPTTANQASDRVVVEGQPPVAASVRVSIREATRTDQRSSAKLKEHLSLSFLAIITAIGVLVHLFFIRRATEPISKNPSLIVASASAFVSLISAFGLMFDTMRQMMSRGRLLGRDSPFSWSKLLLCLSTVSLAFTVIALIASFLPKSYYYLPVVLVPTVPVVGIAFYDVRPTADDVVLGGGDDPHKSDRKRSFQLTINMTTFSFMGALGTIMGYNKNSNRADHIYVKVSIYFMLGAAVTGLVALLLNRLLRRKDWKKTAIGNAVMLGLLVLAVLIVAATFLGGVLAGTPFPVAIAAAIWYFMEYHVLCDDRGDMNSAFSQEKELKPLYTVALTAMSVSFGAVMTVFAGFLGGEEKGGRLEVCVFFVVSCFLSSVSLGMMTFRPPKKASLGAAAMALACITLVLLVLAALALVS